MQPDEASPDEVLAGIEAELDDVEGALARMAEEPEPGPAPAADPPR